MLAWAVNRKFFRAARNSTGRAADLFSGLSLAEGRWEVG